MYKKLFNKKTILITIFILVLLLFLLIFTQTDFIERVRTTLLRADPKPEFSYTIYDNAGEKIKTLVEFSKSEGIDTIEYLGEDGNTVVLKCNGRENVAIDFNAQRDVEYTFKITTTNQVIEEKKLNVNDSMVADKIIITETKLSDTHSSVNIQYNDSTSIKNDYRIGISENWQTYSNDFTFDLYQAGRYLENNDLYIYGRQTNKYGDEIIVKHKIDTQLDIAFKEEETVITGTSLLDCVENNVLQSGNYIFRVTLDAQTIDYPIELYNYSNDVVYDRNNDFYINNKHVTGLGTASSEKRMLVLKYNGNLTIEDGTTFTPTGTSDSINGATGLCTKKGMLVYCAGTITNNGAISMTAKGTVNEAGQNVYLFKNSDGSYEYVPASGGAGGAAIASTGRAGTSGLNRQTGGGGSGGSDSYSGASGSGSAGTSYSGGTGGSGAVRTSSRHYPGVAGASNGGVGGTSRPSHANSGGGAGNPGGYRAGQTGTGGLLVLYANEIINNSVISANGSNGGATFHAGGSSGGGSINIFYKNTYTENGTVTANGGSRTTASGNVPGGAGGNGSITIGSIQSGSFTQ